jgi:hypothetical protein
VAGVRVCGGASTGGCTVAGMGIGRGISGCRRHVVAGMRVRFCGVAKVVDRGVHDGDGSGGVRYPGSFARRLLSIPRAASGQ